MRFQVVSANPATKWNAINCPQPNTSCHAQTGISSSREVHQDRTEFTDVAPSRAGASDGVPDPLLHEFPWVRKGAEKMLRYLAPVSCDRAGANAE